MADFCHQILHHPTGRFVIGGPMGDCGLTGRKSSLIPTAAWRVMVAVRSPVRSIKSGPFRSLRSTLCREKHVAAGLADRCEIQVSYAIGVVNRLPSW